MTRRRFVAFAAAALLLSMSVAMAVLVAADLYLHHRAERSVGLNHRGYRGPVLGRKRAGEVRVAVLGGSTVFGYGGPWYEAFPALLEGMLNQGDSVRHWTVVNLGFNTEGVHALVPTLDDFAYLDFDIACFYVGYNDLLGDGGRNLALMRRSSAVFRLTGYYPILPLVVKEKALALRYGGDLEAAYAAKPGEQARTVFRPSAAARVSAGALEVASQISDSLSRQIARLPAEESRPTEAAGTAHCESPWIHFCDSLSQAVRRGVSRGVRVLVASQPRLPPPPVHDRQREAMATMMAREFAGEPLVRYLDLSDTVDLMDKNYSFDTMHLGLDGNRVIAAAFVDPIRALEAVAPDR